MTETLDLIVADNLSADSVGDSGGQDSEPQDLSAVDVEVATIQNEPITVTLSVEGGDAGDWEFEIVTQLSPGTGSLSSINRIGSNSAEVTYTPAEDFCGYAQFEYDLVNGADHSDAAIASIILYPEVRFDIEILAELPQLSVRAYAFTRTGEDLPSGVYSWRFDDDEVSGPEGTHSSRDYVFSNSGSHVISLTLTLAGLAAPIGCMTGTEGSDQYYRYTPPSNSGILSVSPDTSFTSVGDEEGPFTPSSTPYTLLNSGDSRIEWEVSKNVDWLSISSNAGELAGGESTTVAIMINAAANSLEPDDYSGRVDFTNTTNGVGNTSRDVFLTVNARAGQEEDLTISGRVVDGDGNGIAGALVNGLPGPPVTGPDGQYGVIVEYGFTGIPIFVEKAGYTFNPGMRAYQNLTADQLDQDYVGTPVALTISGRVTDGSGTGISNVAIKGVPGTPMTDGNGYYSVGVEYGFSSDAVWVEKVGYTFSPNSRSYSNLTADQTNQNYVGSGTSVTISGRVLDGSSAGISGVAINGLPGSPVTNSSGYYSVEVENGFDGIAVPSKAGYTFSPVSRSYSNLTADQSNQNYVGSVVMLTISGRVTDDSDAGLGGVVISGLPGSPVTNSNGYYSVGVEYGFSGTAVPSKAGYYNFSPASRSYANLTGDRVNQNYSCEAVSGPVITGTVSRVETVGADVPIGPVTLRFSDSNPDNGNFVVQSDTNGNYSAQVPEGWTGTITAAEPDSCVLYPASLVIDEPVADPQSGLDFTAWLPPIGIPMPEFGIRESHYMYAGQRFDFDGDGNLEEGEEYRDAGSGPYTHYVDNTHPDATDDDNPYGTPDRPRMRIPYDPPLSAGSVVEVHGGPYSYYVHTNNFEYGGDRLPIIGSGTSDKPIFVRGPNAQSKPNFSGTNRVVRPEGVYIILENVDLGRAIDIRPFGDMGGETHHVVVRHCDLHDLEDSAIHVGWLHGYESHSEWRNPTLVTDVVVYNNKIYDLGDWEQTGSSEDYAGVFPHINALRLWVVDNEIYHIDGDGIQINTWGIYDDPDIHKPPHYVYIGRNSIYECQENVLDFKVCQDVIVSQNDLWGIHDHSSTSDGTAVVVHEDSGTDTFPYPERLWYIYNDIHDSDVGLRIQLSDEVYVIGNKIYDIISSYPLMDSSYSSGGAVQCWDNNTIHVVNNMVYNCDMGLLSADPHGAMHIVNNIVFNLTGNLQAQLGLDAYHIRINNSSVADISDMHHNLLYQEGGSIHIRWIGDYETVAAFQAGSGKGEGCLELDPQLADAAAGNYYPLDGSPVIDAGDGYAAYQTFLDLYGLSLAVDCDGAARPAPDTAIIDMGPYEHGGE